MTIRKDDNSSLSDKASAAFKQAAQKVIERAKLTGTPVIVWEDGQIKEISPEEFEKTQQPETKTQPAS